MKQISRNLFSVAVILICLLIAPRFANAQDYLIGSWTVDGADFTALGLNLSGGTNPLLVIEKSGSQYNAHLNMDIFVSEINCPVASTLSILAITPINAMDLNIQVTYPIPFVCTNTQRSYEILISKLAADQNSFTSCRATEPTDCASWVRAGTVDPTPQPEVCSKSLKPKAPTAKVTKKTATISDVSGNTGVKSYRFQLISKKNKKSRTIRLLVNSKKPKIVQKNLISGTWGARVSELCSSKGSSKYSPYTGFTIK